MTKEQFIAFYKVFDRFPTEKDLKMWTPMTKDNVGKVWVENKLKEKDD